tara:strand:+ start:235 stop:393 length:159 start_codon:yes stop_codon:yes gene_type:complete
MYEINLSSTGSIIEFVALALIPVMLWGLYKFEQYREKKMLLNQLREADRIKI